MSNVDAVIPTLVLCSPLRKIPMEDYTLSFIKQMEHSLRTFIPSFCLAKIDSFFMNENPIMMSHGRQKHQASRTLNTSLRLPANLAEIRQVTTVCILFPGLVPSSYSQCLDSVDDLPFVSDAPSPLQPQDAIRTLQGIVHFIQTLLHHHEGCLTGLNVDSEGTKITVTFGLFPFLHEDDPLRAVLVLSPFPFPFSTTTFSWYLFFSCKTILVGFGIEGPQRAKPGRDSHSASPERVDRQQTKEGIYCRWRVCQASGLSDDPLCGSRRCCGV